MSEITDNKTKYYFDATKTLRDSAWDSFDRRRGFEWKLSFGLWTGIGFFGGILVTESQLSGSKCYIILLLLLIFVIHCFWSYSLANSNRVDLKKSYFFEEELLETLDLTEKFKNSEVQKLIYDMNNRNFFERNWGIVTQCLITLLLVLGVIAILPK